MIVQHNTSALNTHRNLGIHSREGSKSLEKLSSGYRINHAADDAAGLAISEGMRAQIRGLEMAEDNTENAFNLIQTADGALQETHDALQRMRELAVQASDGTYLDEDRAQINIEVEALKDEITRIAESTHYNNIKLLDGTLGKYTVYDLLSGESNFQDISGTNATASQTSYAILFTDGCNLEVEIYTGEDGESTFSAMVFVPPDLELAGIPTVERSGSGYVITFTFPGTAIDPYGENPAQLEVVIEDLPEAYGAYRASVALSSDGIRGGTVTAVVQEEEAGALSDGMVFQVGANGSVDQLVSLWIEDMSAAALGLTDLNLLTRESANNAISVLDQAIDTVNDQRSQLGAVQNRLEHTLNSLGVSVESLSAAESTIRNLDMAHEVMKYTKNSLLYNTTQAMLAQANKLPERVLSLLGYNY